jgi:aryl-alcohol dehydrogenase-like predicted oxidoreductase
VEYRTLGTSDIATSVIGFGCGGNARLMVGDDEALRLGTIRSALHVGVNYFDTAAEYGDGRSETNLADGLRSLAVPSPPIISTKVAVQADDSDDLASAVQRRFEGSLARLGRESVDILLLHNRVFLSPDPGAPGIGVQLTLDQIFGKNGVVTGFDRLKSEGRVKVAAFTALGGNPEAIETLVDSGVFGALNVSFNLLSENPSLAPLSPYADFDSRPVLKRAAAAGMGIMAVQVLARGKLATDAVAPELAHLASLALSYDDSLVSFAIRYVLSKPFISSAILGLSEPGHVDQAVAAMLKGPLPEDAVYAVENTPLMVSPEDYLHERPLPLPQAEVSASPRPPRASSPGVNPKR